ncbi:hypothetical protein EDM52_21490 [Brevibacillus invocatus]|uniref:Uncharacterized protein n=1 Tax=Brevibacillus invocatus TaxID=173959 RepID=A0A3M8BXA0_9BACL|nr:hypothetical protein [Brevibacillus invocatus]RNB68061.1 hypothetical protein EDM52_21490 [Brevibacillus invocatus]
MPVKKKTPTKLSPNKEKILLLKRQAAYYEEKAIQYSHELQQLQEHVVQVEEREKEQQKQLEGLNQAFARQQARETEWNDKLESYSTQIRDLESRLAQQAKLLSQRENTISHYKEKEEKWKSSSSKQKAEQYEQQLQEQLKLNARSMKEMDTLKLSLEQANHQLKAAKEKEAKLTDHIQRYTSVIENYQKKEQEWSQTVEALHQSEQELEKLQKQRSHQANVEEVWRQSLEQASNQLSAAKEQVAKLTDQVRQLTTDIESHQTKEQEWQQTIEDLRQAHLELQQELQQVIAAHEQEADQQASTNAEKIRLLEQQLSEVSSSHTEAQTGWSKQLEEKEKLIAKLQHQVTTLQTTIEHLRKVNAGLQEKENKYKQSIQEYVTREARTQKANPANPQAPSTTGITAPISSIQLPSQSHASFLKNHQSPLPNTFNPFKTKP